MAQLSARIDAAKVSRAEGDLLLAECKRLLASAEGALPAFFGLLPTADLEWRVDPLGPPAWYESPPLDRLAPGTFVVNLANPTLETMYDEAVLVHHETFPGRHLQFGVAADLAVPTFHDFRPFPSAGGTRSSKRSQKAGPCTRRIWRRRWGSMTMIRSATSGGFALR